MKGRLFYCIVIILCGLIMTGAGLSVYFVTNTDRRDVVRVELKDGETEHITFDAKELLPGKEVGYGISLHTNFSGTNDVLVAFDETPPTVGGLKDFVWVRLASDGKTFYEAPLANALSREAFLLEQGLISDKSLLIEVVYYMPKEIGNEAQGLDGCFTLSICASNEGDTAYEKS